MKHAIILLASTLALGACGDNLAGVTDEPCDAPAEGRCSGNTLETCAGDTTRTEPCGVATCTLDGDRFACVDPCEVAGVTEDGTCTGDTITRCGFVDDRHVIETITCDVGTRCTEVAGQPAECAVDACADIGPLGRCQGNNLHECVGGAPQMTDCSVGGQVCGYADNTEGYACIAPAGAFVVHGVVRYEDRPPLPDGSLGPIQLLPARGAEISIVLDQGSTVLATAHTADDGSYVLRYDTTAGNLVHVMVTARSTVPLRPLRVNRTQNQTHAFGGGSFAAATPVQQDVLVTDASGLSEAFNILDQGVLAMDVLRLQMGQTPQLLTARWSRGSNNGTYYSNGGIFLLGAASDDDGYDDTVILHEIGHWVEDIYGRTDSPGGAHDGSPTDPNLAWSEGCSTYFAMAVRDRPHYMDSNAGGGWGYDAEETVTALASGSTIGSDISEDTVSEILWDIADGGPADDDLVTTANHRLVLLVWTDYLATANLRAVGENGADLVDFLDGWFVTQGLSTCAGVRGIVNVDRAFPYDYGSSAGPCP